MIQFAVIAAILLLLGSSALVGMAAGVFAVQVVAVHRGRISLKISFALVLIAALEASLVAQHPAGWLALLGFFLLGASAMVLVDLPLLIWFDSRGPTPRFSPDARRLAWAAIPVGLVVVCSITSALFKHVITLNPDGSSWLTGIELFFTFLTPAAVIDLIARVIFAKIRPGRVG